jgi:hypothetical protein
LPLFSVSNHGFSGDPAYLPSSRAVALPIRTPPEIATATEVLKKFMRPLSAKCREKASPEIHKALVALKFRGKRQSQ